MSNRFALVALAAVVGVVTLVGQEGGDSTYLPKRVNKAIELLEQGQPIYYTQVNGGGYEEGKRLAQTWADYITYNLEHSPFDMTALRAFMQGLVDGGPTRSGHRTPTVIAVLPFGGINETVLWSNYWMVEHLLGSGVHGVLLAHARSPEAVKVLVQAARYPHAPKTDGFDEGLRGSGGQGFAARIWGVSGAEYQRMADPWPLNPDGEVDRAEDRGSARARAGRGQYRFAWRWVRRVGAGRHEHVVRCHAGRDAAGARRCQGAGTGRDTAGGDLISQSGERERYRSNDRRGRSDRSQPRPRDGRPGAAVHGTPDAVVKHPQSVRVS